MDILEQRFEEYCRGCPEIEPRFNKACLHHDGQEELVSMIIYCEKENICKALYSRLKQSAE